MGVPKPKVLISMTNFKLSSEKDAASQRWTNIFRRITKEKVDVRFCHDQGVWMLFCHGSMVMNLGKYPYRKQQEAENHFRRLRGQRQSLKDHVREKEEEERRENESIDKEMDLQMADNAKDGLKYILEEKKHFVFGYK